MNTKGRLTARSAIPPLHPNCRCRLVALDGLGELVYNVGREAFLDEAGAALDGQGGNLFALAHDGFRSRLSPANFQPLKTQETPAISGDEPSDATLWDSVAAWGRKFGQDAAAAYHAAVGEMVGRGASAEDALYDIYLAVSSGNLLDVLESITNALPTLVNWLTLGSLDFIRGYFEQNQSNFRQWVLDQTDYNFLNWLLLGIPENMRDAILPEEPLSFAHFLSLAQAALLLYGAYQVGIAREAVLADPKLPDPGMPHVAPEYENSVERPTWRQSESEIADEYPEYSAQRSFKNGEEVPYGTKGSVRPDFYQPGKSVEVKNYNIATENNRNNLIRNIVQQYNKRLSELPPGTRQLVIIDIRSQNISQTIIDSLYSQIMQRANYGLEILFKK